MKGISFGFKTMLSIDHFIGLPLCVLIGIWASFTRLFLSRKNVIPQNPKRIIILKWFGMGSIILTRDLVYSLRRRYPQAKLVFLTFSNQLPVIKSLDLSDEIVVVKKDTLWAFVVSALKLLFMLLFKKSDIAIDLEYYSKFSAIVTYLSGAPVRIGFYLPSFWREALFTHLVYFNYFRHITETYSMVGSILGVKVSDMPCRFNTDESQRKSVEVILRQKGWVEGNKLIGINCNAGELAHCRRWPQEHFAKLINALGELSGYTVILVGSGDDMSYVNGLYNNLNSAVKKNVINAAGLFNITQFFALISMMKLFITNDSGPLHLAHLAGTPTISFWGPSPTWLYGAKDKNKHKQLFQAIACSPCMGVHRAQAGIFCNQTIPCLTNILPEDVIACAKEILGVI